MPAEKTSLIYDLKDPSFSINNSRDYRLVIVLSDSSLILLVYYPNTNKYLSLKSWDIPGMKMLRNAVEFIRNIPELNYPFQKKILSVNTPTFTLVPEEYFAEELAEKYFHLNYENRQGEIIKTEIIKNLNTKLVYSLNLNYEFINEFLNPDIIVHSANSYIVSILTNIENYLSKKLFADIEKNFIRMAVLVDGKLQLYNTFPYKTQEDLLYHLANVSREFKFKPDSDKYYLTGRITKESELYKSVFKYFRYPLLMPRPEQFTYSPVLSAIPSHLFYNAYTVLLCE